MLNNTTENLRSFLEETEYCDCNHKDIQGVVDSFRKKYPDQKELAIALFYYVRDGFLYRVGHWNKKASETLLEKKGVCTSKSNLLVALLRAAGIPAGYGVMKVEGKEYFGKIVPSFLTSKIASKSTHIYTCVYLNNRWIKCDPSDDKKFSENTCYFNPQCNLVDWDGENDAMLNLKSDHILSDQSPLADIDDIIRKKPRSSAKLTVKAGNFYVEFLRENPVRITNLAQLESLFKKWLKKNHFFFHYFFFFCFFCWKTKNKL